MKSLGEMVSITTIIPWKDNPKKDEAEAAALPLSDIIKKHGFISPLIVWRQNKVIYKGNTSYKAARILGLKEVPVIFEDFKDANEAIAYALDDNRASEFSEWDKESLAKLLSSKEVLSKTAGFEENYVKNLKKKKEEKDSAEDSIFQKTVIIFYKTEDKESFLPELKKLIESKKYENVQIH